MNVFHTYISRSFSFGVKLEVRKFINLIEFGFQDSLSLGTKLTYKKLHLKFYGYNAELFSQGQ